MSGKDFGVLGVQLVKRRKLPVCGGLDLGVVESSHFPEHGNLFDKVLQTLGVHREAVVVYRLLQRCFFVLL
jgi:hypothetical protein